MLALGNLGVSDDCSLEFCCEKDRWCRHLINQNHAPKVFNEDITVRVAAAAPPCDLYVAGFPCQPFSTAGLRQGRADPHGRGTIFDHILSYLQAHRPRAVVLENVLGLLHHQFEDTFRDIIASLRAIRGPDGAAHYVVSHRIVNTADWGVPHHRQRVYILCLWSATMDPSAPFMWPRPSRAATRQPLNDLLEARRGGPADVAALGPATRARLEAYLQQLRSQGHNPDTETWIVDVFGTRCHGMLDQCPCLTRSRAGAGGHWVTNRSRLLTLTEMLRLQGISPKIRREGISDRQVGLMVGNAMSVNVLERILVRLLPAVGLIARSRLQDKWA
jgi:DNA (cytosine-5)-methyltransferase 1